ncbi:MAG: hypothetical protein KBT20_03380 [Bacteroidales bacterium]|nr:hypothetical protein [Candidatus Liminaster caballi]
MKHLIIFLDYCRSRLDNPVYRIFSKETASRRNTTLLFLPRPLEERELLHEVADLRRKEKVNLSDVTFHVCGEYDHANEGENMAQTVRMIRRLFPADDNHTYQCFAYALLPDLAASDEKQIKTIWNNLADVNNAITEYTEFRLFDRVFLYHDASQQSLADFLFERIHFGISIDEPEGLRTDKTEWPPVFATFNATGITYPEANVREYLHRKYVSTLLRYSLTEYNQTSIEQCTEEAKHILSFVPIQNSRLCLQEEMFLNTDGGGHTNWKPVAQFWKNTCEVQSQGMNDIPHDEWLNKIRQRLEVIYQSRFRDTGVEYFFQLQGKKSSTYVSILKSIISQEFNRTIQNNPYTPEAQKTILRSIVNILQQKVLELQKLQSDTETAVKAAESLISSVVEKWNGLNIFSRMMKKDNAVLESYTAAMQEFYTQKTLYHGVLFAIKLLNELIPTLLDMVDQVEQSRKILDEAIRVSDRMLQESDPSLELGRFSKQQVEIAAQELANDSDHYVSRYLQVIQFFCGNNPVADSEDLVARIHTNFGDDINQYIIDRIAAETLPPVLNQAITERMSALYADRGGLGAFIGLLKDHTKLQLALKDNSNTGHYMLVTPAQTDDEEVEHIMTGEVSHIEMLHILQGLRLTDLDGFSGQRMFIEPTLF